MINFDQKKIILKIVLTSRIFIKIYFLPVRDVVHVLQVSSSWNSAILMDLGDYFDFTSFFVLRDDFTKEMSNFSLILI